MKRTLVWTFIAAFACSSLLISTASAGGRHAGGVSTSSATSTTSTATATGRSPLGEPVFLIPSTSSSQVATSSGNGNGRERIQHVSPTRESAHIMTPTTTGGSERGTKVIFTPPPTIVGVQAGGAATGNVSGNNVAADRPFGGSLLNSGLGSKSSQPTSDVQLSVARPAFVPSIVPVGPGPQGPPTLDHATTTTSTTATNASAGQSTQPPWVRITPVTYAGPTVEVPTTSSSTGH